MKSELLYEFLAPSSSAFRSSRSLSSRLGDSDPDSWSSSRGGSGSSQSSWGSGLCWSGGSGVCGSGGGIMVVRDMDCMWSRGEPGRAAAPAVN